MKGSPTNQLYFRIAAFQGESARPAQRGFKQFMMVLDAARITISAMALAWAGPLGTIYQIRPRREALASRLPASIHPDELADMATELEGSRLLCSGGGDEDRASDTK